ncbi:ATP-grasp domain-containing protein [Lipingzhangella sp. LS1_29]|uniref:ATP-grasp domain-containing protein n=1 Tax=Lipingzhangella rawalii TaxID=2055835 RepID=A0ABU2H458_9ACTN|nr:ATP-grasp domain-containing protein [Lipingzhangella rawalii]MDS1269615.1 ATP-grasp domain-containing protein [Lipingzhangella rawalii]
MPRLERKDQVAIVDAYSGGRYLIPAMQALGYPVVHIQSDTTPPRYFLQDNDSAARNANRHIVHYEQDSAGLAQQLRCESVRLVLAGSEGGVLLADQLAERLDLPFRNDIHTSVARRDKFEMQERLRAAGLANIAQARVHTPEELDAWLDRHESYPVVLKPLASAGTDGVHICSSRAEAHEALERILGQANIFGAPNDAALCQEYLTGTEYVLNGIACQGKHVFTEGWRSDKINNNGFRVYDTQYLFYVGDPGFTELSDYVAAACTALGIVNGPFHAEVMHTDRGPVLIEVGARIAGGADPYVVESCLGHSQVSYLVHSSLHPELFRERRGAHNVEMRRRHAAYVFLIAREPGRVRRLELEEFLKVDGVVHVDYHYEVGDLQEMTRDLVTSAGVVMVTAHDRSQLDAAVRRIREIEAAMYERSVDTVTTA